jgi:negative regulator of replication initiation
LEKVERGLYEYNNDNYYIDYSYLSDNTKKFLKKSENHILKLKKMLKEQKESKKTQLEEKEEEITRLKNEKEDKKVDDEIKKVLKLLSIPRPKLKKPKG